MANMTVVLEIILMKKIAKTIKIIQHVKLHFLNVKFQMIVYLEHNAATEILLTVVTIQMNTIAIAHLLLILNVLMVHVC